MDDMTKHLTKILVHLYIFLESLEKFSINIVSPYKDFIANLLANISGTVAEQHSQSLRDVCPYDNGYPNTLLLKILTC